MKSGGPWNLRGLRPQTREAARTAARESGMSVGEWLNDVLQPEDDEDFAPERLDEDDDDTREADRHSRERDPRRDSRNRDSEDRARRKSRQEPRQEPRFDKPRFDEAPRSQNQNRDRSDRRARERDVQRDDDRDIERSRDMDRDRDIDRDRDRPSPRLREAARAAARARDEERQTVRVVARETARLREEARTVREELRQAAQDELREAARAEEARQAARARGDIGEVHARLDRLSHQLERIARQDLVRPEAPRLNGAPPAPHRGRPMMERPRNGSRTAPADTVSVDDAIAEITDRQRTLYGEASVGAPPVQRPTATFTAAPFTATSFTAAPFAPPMRPELVGAPQPQPLSFSARAPQPLAPQPLPPSAMPKPAPVPDAVSPPIMPNPAPTPPAAPAFDLFKLEEQLRNMTARIETLKPSSDFEDVIKAFRKDLADIGRQITEALPRHAVESLQIEVQALAQRIDHSRGAGGVDMSALAGLERGLAEVRDALHGLTPAENLVGFDDAVRTLSQKVDLIIGKEDPATLQQLETAISALRGIVSHVASNDTLTKVAEDVRSLAAKVDDLANNPTNGQAVAALESRLDTLANALNASTEAGHAVPRELEKLLSGLIEKLEWVQLTHTDHAALGHLEDRIAQLIKRLDASDARLGNLQGIERGLADLLVHIDEVRSGGSAGLNAGLGVAAAPEQPAIVDVIKREVEEIKRSDRRTQDSLEAVHGAVEKVVDRLAMIESGRLAAGSATGPATGPAAPAAIAPPAPGFASAPSLTSAPSLAPAPIEIADIPSPQSIAPAMAAPAIPATMAPAEAAPATILDAQAPLVPTVAEASSFETPLRRAAAPPRKPIDPNLPPDHPLEPGSTPGSRAVPSAADRIAASEAAAGLVQPPAAAVPDEKSNYLTAARKAAQAAAAAPTDRKSRKKKEAAAASASPQRFRRLLVAGGAVVVAALCVHIVLHMFQDNGSTISPPPLPEPSTSLVPEKDSAIMPPPSATLLALPVPNASPDTATNPEPSVIPSFPSATPGQPLSLTPDAQPLPPPAALPAPVPQRQSALPNMMDVTGSLPQRVPPPAFAAPQPAVPPPPQAMPSQTMPSQTMPIPAADADKLPATIGGPALRAAAAAGDVSAEYEVATRFAEGHGVPPNNELATHWLQRAADQGSAPAAFRLGGVYEKGIGVKKDLAKARDLYTAAANKGNAKAMHNLAVLYAEGVNGPADYKTASLWFRKAADRGVTDSQYNLAILYARGIGVEQNYAESFKWFTLAADHGDADAGKKRDEIASHLDAQTLAAAQAAIQKWTATPQPDDAINVKTPPGGWDPQTAKAAKPKVSSAKPSAAAPEAKL